MEQWSSFRPQQLLLAWFGGSAAVAAAVAWAGSGRLSAGVMQGGAMALAGAGAAAISRTLRRGERSAEQAAAMRTQRDYREREAQLMAEAARAREAAAAAEARFRSTFEQAAVGMSHAAPDGQILRANQRYCDLTGYTAEDLLRLTVYDVTHPDDRETQRGHFDRLLDGETGTATWESRYIRKDGSVIRVNLTVSLVRAPGGGPLYLAGSAEDMTARVRAQEAVRESEQRFRQVAEHAPFGIVVESGRAIRYLNPAAARLFGAANPHQLVGAPLLDRVHPEDRAAGPAQRRCLRLDGEPFPVEIFRSPIVFDGQPAALLLIRDRTRECRAEQERLRLEQRLRRAEQVEGIGRLAVGVAHGFNNNLTVINGYCEMLLDELTAGDPLAEDLGEIRAAANRAAGLSRQLLAISQQQPAQPRRLDVNTLVREHCRVLGRVLGENVEVLTDLGEGVGAIEAERSQIQLLLTNLSVNASEAMPRGGKLILLTANADISTSSPAPTGAGVPPGRYVVLAVSDTGVGMSRETLAHIFEPFFSTKSAGNGAGLGLATVSGIVQQSGGHIRVSSEPGAGSTFRIYLPRAADEGAQVNSPRGCNPRLPGSK